ncbi:MAG TPA: heme-binding protein [Burkholderiaceae bacterium]|jgi:hypothetical protein|nr:heme-binding protein [Burkholderiaceae bacterium]
MNRLKQIPAALFAAAIVPRIVEEPPFIVLRTEDEFEVRRYEPHVLAEAALPGPADYAADAGFHLLNEYLAGRNTSRRRFGTHSPLILTPAATSLDARVPMIPSMAVNGFVVQFVMPIGQALSELPVPKDSRVRLRSVASETRIVHRYAGNWSQQTYRRHLETLRRAVAHAGMSTRGEPAFVRFDAPYVLPFLRRNEIWLAVG